jgi:hypothetical protein
MKKAHLLAVVLLLWATAASALVEVETTGAMRVTPANGFALYNTTGITIGSYLYVYHQGGAGPGEDGSCPYNSDKIIAYRALISNGVPGTFQRVGRISPCVFSPTQSPTHPNYPYIRASYGPGQIFKATIGGVTKYHLLADASDTIAFYHAWRGESSDGINWKWYISDETNNSQYNGVRETIHDSADVVTHTIDIVVQPESFIHSTTVMMLNPIILSTNATSNNAPWWGFFNFWSGTSNVGQISVDWDMSNNPTVKMVTNPGPPYTWTTLPSTGGPGGSALLNFSPYAFRTNVNAKTLLYDATYGGHQLWATSNNLGTYAQYVGCDTTRMLTCSTPGGCLTGDGSGCPYGATCNVFLRNTGPYGDVYSGNGSGFMWWGVTQTTFGGDNIAYSYVRYSPSGYSEARLFPFRWNSPTGRRYLFSATNDANICNEFLFSSYFKMYVVMQEIALQ